MGLTGGSRHRRHDVTAVSSQCRRGAFTVPSQCFHNAPQSAEQSRTLRPIFRSAHDTFIHKDTAALLAQYSRSSEYSPPPTRITS